MNLITLFILILIFANMNKDCLFNILLYSLPNTISKIVTSSTTYNTLTTNHLWKILHTRDYETPKLVSEIEILLRKICELQNRDILCNDCFQDTTSQLKILNKEYYQLYKSHNVFYDDIQLNQSNFTIIGNYPYIKYLCQLDNFTGNHVCVSFTFNNKTKNIGNYLPLYLFYNKKQEIKYTYKKHLY